MVLSLEEWQPLARRHEERVASWVEPHLARRRTGTAHPVEDFLFTYYSYKPSVLRRWHPGAGVELEEAAGDERAGWRWYATGTTPGSLVVDRAGFEAAKPQLLALIDAILRRTASRPGQFGCFGLHEWAMVYRQGDHRHPQPLRLGQSGTDAVMESHELRCTHFDAFRFFTPDAVPRNRELLSRDGQPEREQPGCLHAGMDVYKWAVKLGPLVPGELLLDAFELARDIRRLDMEASPYDLADWGFEPVAIETPEGKAEYVRCQRELAARGNVLREKILTAWHGRD